MLDEQLDHGYGDVGNFFPTWGEFLDRSSQKREKYKNYMAYLLCKHDSNEIIGVLAVQYSIFDELIRKVQTLTPRIKNYLYLSWIALDRQYQKVNYFALLFEFFHVLVRKLQDRLGTRVGGAAVTIRRMRPLMWSLLNLKSKCPETINESILHESPKITYFIKPGELIDPNLKPPQDHVLILFDTVKEYEKQDDVMQDFSEFKNDALLNYTKTELLEILLELYKSHPEVKRAVDLIR
ncbi:MAG: hypothetical protein ACFFCS_29820 [Candidatus Hodarchaeota archaeon]